MADSLTAVVKRSLDKARTTHVVGAGIGVRRVGASTTEPRLTLLVDRDVPKEQLMAAVRLAAAGSVVPDFDVLNVGEVRALPKMR
ncbi:MAG: hypothetical protein ACM3WU_03440 [Bacillota bacterium]